MAFCSKCGTKVSTQADFCSSCGTDLSEFKPEETFEPKRIPIPDVKIPKISIPKISLPALNWKLIGVSVAAISLVVTAGYTIQQFAQSTAADIKETPEGLTLTMAPELDKFGGQVDRFSGGLIAVRDGERFGYTNELGDVVISPGFAFASPFLDGVALVAATRGNVDARAVNRAIRGKGDGSVRFWYITSTGKLLVDKAFNRARQFSEGLAAVQVGQKWGFIDQDGAFAIQPQYDHALSFSEGIAVVAQRQSGLLAIDKTGNKLFDIGQYRAEHFSDGLLRVSGGSSKNGYINASGELEIDFSSKENWPDNAKDRANFSARGDFNNGLAAVIDGDQRSGPLGYRCGYINKSGSIEIEPVYDDCGDFRGGIAAVGKRSGKGSRRIWHFIDTKGNNVFQREFERVKDRFLDKNSILQGVSGQKSADDHWIIEDAGKSGVVSQNGDLIEPKYDFVKPMTHGLYAVLKDRNWGVVNTKGEFLLEPQFDQIGTYSDGRAWVSVDGKLGYISE